MSKLQETLNEVKEDYEDIEPSEKDEIVGRINEYIKNGADKAFQAVRGLPGAGKTVCVRKVVKKIKTDNQTFICCIDISGCTNEMMVYNKIAIELQAYLKKKGQTKGKKCLDTFLRIYEWIYGNQNNNSFAKYEDSLDAVDAGTTLIQKCQTAFDIWNNENDSTSLIANNKIWEKAGLLCDVFPELLDVIPPIKATLVIGGLFAKNAKERATKQAMIDTIEVLEAEWMQRKFFCGLLIHAMSEAGLNKPAIILDNFQLITNNQLGRDHVWLTAPNGIMQNLKAMWIVVSRDDVSNHFTSIFPEQNDLIVINGFTEEDAKKYVLESIDKVLKKREKTLCDSDKTDITNKILEVCSMEQFYTDPDMAHQNICLPYLLHLAMQHFDRLITYPDRPVEPENFIKLRTQEEYVGYYFRQNLSDLMLNAFQILCCLPEWDEVWITLVREKFDNHLLNAHHLLMSTAPVEPLGNESYKLHEAIKDGLYNESHNFIKEDVLKYLYEKFIEIYGAEDNKKIIGIWSDIKRIGTFLDLIHSYIKQYDNNKAEQYELIEGIKKAISNIGANNKARGVVTEEFIRLYSKHVDFLKDIYGIPFINAYESDFNAGFDFENEFKKSKIDCLKMDHIEYYMNCFYELTFFYTNLNSSGIALILEKRCVEFWEHMEKCYNEGSLDYWSCRKQRIHYMNAVAYDGSQEHKYEIALQYGGEGLQLLKDMGKAILDDIEPQTDLSLILSPDVNNEFHLQDFTGIDQKLFKSLKDGYKKLIEWQKTPKKDRDTKDSDSSRLKTILAELLLTDQQNLRGNFPWYCINYNGNNEVGIEVLTGDECWQYGVRTYWMRKARLEALRSWNIGENKGEKGATTERNYRNAMLGSFHNVCVYLYKTRHVEQACIFEHELITLEMQALGKKNIDEAKARIIEGIRSIPKDKEAITLWQYIWEMIEPEVRDEDFWGTPDSIVEHMQYLGDYYLHMQYYAIAFQQLAAVTLRRYLWYGISDNRTMDSFLRLYVASYACHYGECTDKIEREAIDSLHIDAPKDTIMQEARKGLSDKNFYMKKLIEIGKGSTDVEAGIREMLDLLK